MPKLYFRYGAMNSSKTANLLMVAHNYQIQDRLAIITKPSIDIRYGNNIIKSRALEGREVDFNIYPECEDFNSIPVQKPTVECILVDEAQFLTEKNVEGLRRLAEQIPVICYGLRTDYRGRLFPGSKRLLELADTIEEIKTVCTQCNRKAIINAKFTVKDGFRKVIKEGSSEPDLGSEEKYQALCWSCWSKS